MLERSSDFLKITVYCNDKYNPTPPPQTHTTTPTQPHYESRPYSPELNEKSLLKPETSLLKESATGGRTKTLRRGQPDLDSSLTPSSPMRPSPMRSGRVRPPRTPRARDEDVTGEF